MEQVTTKMITHPDNELIKTAPVETQWKPNVTVAAIIERDKKFLVVEERSQGRLVFNQPAGHLEEGETLLEAVTREVREETAWGFKPESATGIYMHTAPAKQITYLRVCFVGSCYDHNPDQALDDGIHQALWMSLDELRLNFDRLRTPLVLNCITDYMDGNRIPLEYLKHQLPTQN